MDLFVYVTFPSIDEARALGKALVEARLAGCVNILPGMVSIYAWQGDLCQDLEIVLIAKSTQEKIVELTSFIKQRHSYSTPCIATISVEHQNQDYANWLHSHLNQTN
jgi:periplasmic divalent cation tolerance protein